MTLSAFADRPTPANLTVHNYYNLDGSADARDHVLTLAADLFLPTDAGWVPTGEVAAVDGTPLDFRAPRRIRSAARDLDVPYVLRRVRVAAPTLARAATLASPAGDLAMEIWTTEPGLQVYDGHKMDVPVSGLGGVRYGRCAGIALEAQRFPDAPNHAHLDPCILVPGAVSRQVTEIRFLV